MVAAVEARRNTSLTLTSNRGDMRRNTIPTQTSSRKGTDASRGTNASYRSVETLAAKTKDFSRKSIANSSTKASSLCSSRSTGSKRSKNSSSSFLKIFDCRSFNESKKICRPSTTQEMTLLVRHDPRLVLVYFGAQWCGGCRRLLPEIEKWAGDYPDVVFCAIDVDRYSDIADEFDIEDLPTVIFFKHGDVVQLVRGADVKLVHATIVRHRDAPGAPRGLRPVVTTEDFRNVVERERGPVVLLVQDGGSQLDDVMRRLAGQIPYALVCRVEAADSRGIVRKLDVKKFPTVLVFLDGRLVRQMTAPSEAALRRKFRFLLKPQLAKNELIILRSEDNYKSALAMTKTGQLVVVYFFADYCDHCKKLDQIIFQIAENNHDVVFCKMDVEDNKGFIKKLGLKKVPTFHLYRNKALLEEVVGSRDKHLKKLIHNYKK